MQKIGFVILHYKVIDKTITCIDSIIQRIDTENYEIVVVDNGSCDDTGEKINEIYKENLKVHTLINKENLGFSKGNNLGYIYAKNNLKCNFIAMINNDTYLIQDNFFQVILEEYQRSNFSVMGPKIITKEANPVLPDGNLITLNRQKKYLRNLKIKCLLNFLGMDYVTDKIIEQKKENKTNEDKSYLEKRREKVILHGCCLIFSPTYINKFDGLEEKTFLYCEEEFLYIRLMKNNLKSVYNPQLLIYHDEAASTNQVSKKNRLKKRFVYKNLIKANEILKKDLEQLRRDNYEQKY
ncbi:MAG: glycosyltransferase family 2 protein [Clostridia bacterium]|nr:glycosyltransferase family 2 protein [Clostridia bacterium]